MAYRDTWIWTRVVVTGWGWGHRLGVGGGCCEMLVRRRPEHFALLGHPLQWRLLPLAVHCCFFRPIEAQDHRERPLGRRQPVGFLFLARGFVLDRQRQPAVGIALELWHHR